MEESDFKKIKKPNPRANANIFSLITFLYTLPTFIKGYKKNFTSDDIYETLPDQKANNLGALASQLWSEEVSNAEKNGKEPTLYNVLIKMFGWQYFYLLLLVAAREVFLQVCLPIALGEMISAYGVTDKTNTLYVNGGYIIVSTFLSILIYHVHIIETFALDVKVVAALFSLVYKKILKLNQSSLGQTTPGQIINLLSNDISVFDKFVHSTQYIFIAPIQSAIIIYLMYKEVGVPSIFGACFTLCFVPIYLWTGKIVSKYNVRAAIRRDERLRLMNEIIQGIDIIKMYAWEKPFEKLITFYRKLELNAIKVSTYAKLPPSFHTLFITTSVFITLVSSTLFNTNLNAKSAFLVTTLIAIFCNTCMFFVPFGIICVQQARVSVDRITTFLLSNEIQEKYVDSAKEYAVSITRATAKWDDTKTQNVFKNLTLNFSFESLTAVIGPVGCGKSSLLQVILQELALEEGELSVTGVLSYSSQEAWLFSGSVRQNILFGSKMDEKRYEEVIKCCALERDFKLFTHGDKTVVGDKGASLSGGQKARINLARAIYRDADIYLLDDPLSAVDTHVGKQIFEDCICTFLKGKTIVLVTHQLQYLKRVNHIVVLNEGCIKVEGSPTELRQTGFDFAKYLKHDEENEHDTQKQNSNSLLTDDVMNNHIAKEEESTLNSKSVLLKMYKEYMRASNSPWMVFLSFFCFAATQLFTSLSFYFIAYWIRLKRELPEDVYEKERNLNIYVYCAITLTAIVFSIFRVMAYVKVSMRSSMALHTSMFNSLSYAPLRFFNLNSSGTILNRFSKDLGTIDDFLPNMAINTLKIFFNAIGMLAVICTVSFWFIIPTIGILIAFFYARKMYLITNLSILRLESISRSPIYGYANSSVQGLTTIRVFGIQEILTNEFSRLVDTRNCVYFLFLCTARALIFWTDFVCFLFTVFIVAYFSLNKDSSGEYIGLAISQIIQLTGHLTIGIKQLTDLENCMISVERVLEYNAIEPEPQQKISSKIKLPPSWPEYGRIKFENVYLKYSINDKYTLKNLNFTVESQGKIGIVGRTGAGKSSTITALFQLTETEGLITIDDVNIQKIGLHDLRKNISIIPQNPVLFSGTVRKNLDPFDEYNDEILWKALEEVSLKGAIDKMDAGLNSDISQNGTNLSVGQRQLICLARAIIRNNKVLILDEATANVDLQTDDIIQETIRRKFSNCTVLTVAHRLMTIMDSEKVLVMDAGEVLEYDHPYTLLQNRNSAFYGMVQETEHTMANILIQIAKESYHRMINKK